jgi:PKD repeat protein
MFTIGQAARMTNSALGVAGGRNQLHANSNLIATGVLSPAGPCAPIADFYALRKEVCVNTNAPFVDLSYNGNVTSWQWTFSDGNCVNPSIQHPTATFTNSGIKEVKLKVSNAISSDSIAKKAVIVLAGPGTGTINIAQGFENLTLPDNTWITNVPQIGAGWIINSTTAASGSHCLMIDNYFDSPSEEVDLYSPMYDISALISPALTFDLAYSQNASGSNDRLRVYYSTDCAATWNTLYNKSGSSLHTLGGGIYAGGAFLTPTSSQWRNEIVSLAAAGTANNLLIKLAFTKDSMNPGNNIFIDNINIQTIPVVNENKLNEQTLILYPNPGREYITLLINSNLEDDCKIELSDVTGKLIWKKDSVNVIKGTRILIPVGTLNEGMYFVKLINGNNFCVKKVIVD